MFRVRTFNPPMKQELTVWTMQLYPNWHLNMHSRSWLDWFTRKHSSIASRVNICLKTNYDYGLRTVAIFPLRQIILGGHDTKSCLITIWQTLTSQLKIINIQWSVYWSKTGNIRIRLIFGRTILRRWITHLRHGSANWA